MPSSPAQPTVPSVPTVPERLLAFLDRLGAELDRRGDAVALLGLLEAHVELDPTIVAAVRDLVARSAAEAQSRASSSS